jgi:3-deoxy-D-manno-octulosonic-acid transferase
VAALAALRAAARAGLGAALVIAPRHPERVARAAELNAQRGRRWRRRSAPGSAALAAGEVLLHDSLGELAALYPRARVAFVGGTLVPVGGHSVIEPAMAGCPVLFGPHVANARESVALLLAADGAAQVADAAALAAGCVEALADPARAAASGARGREALAPHRGATQRSVVLIERVLGGAA